MTRKTIQLFDDVAEDDVDVDDGGSGESEGEEDEEEECELTAKQIKRIERMKRYPASQRALKSSWFDAGAELLDGFKEKREAKKAAVEKTKRQLQEAVNFFEMEQREEGKAIESLTRRLAAIAGPAGAEMEDGEAQDGPPLAFGSWLAEYDGVYGEKGV